MEAGHKLIQNISLTIEHKGVRDTRRLYSIEVSQSAPVLKLYCESTETNADVLPM